MTNIDIKISIKKLSHYSESLKRDIDDKTLLLMIKSFSKYVLELYGRLVEEEIFSRKYKGKWEPVEDKEYQKYVGTKSSTHIIYLIREALEVKKIGTNFVVRIDPHYKYPNSDLPLLKVLRAIENGTSKFNSRPILARNAKLVNSHIIDLWRGFLTMKGVV